MLEKDKVKIPTHRGSVFNWKHLNDQRLYTDNEYAIAQLKQGIDFQKEGYPQVQEQTDKRNYHCYWYGNFSRKQLLCLKSFICTQDPHKCRIILWLDLFNGYHQFEQNRYLREILDYIEVRPYNAAAEVKDTPWQNHSELASYSNDYYDLVKQGDAFRFLILYKYGGVYFDLDVMFLKDLSCFTHTEFCYAWEKQPFANSAIFNLEAGSKIATYLMEKCISVQAVSPWFIFLYTDLLLKDLYVLPCAIFDPVWQGLYEENVSFYEFFEFFRPFNQDFPNKMNITSYQDFFPGCYAYHWHNEWTTAEHTDSFFGIFENEFNILLKNRQGFTA